MNIEQLKNAEELGLLYSEVERNYYFKYYGNPFFLGYKFSLPDDCINKQDILKSVVKQVEAFGIKKGKEQTTIKIKEAFGIIKEIINDDKII